MNTATIGAAAEGGAPAEVDEAAIAAENAQACPELARMFDAVVEAEEILGPEGIDELERDIMRWREGGVI